MSEKRYVDCCEPTQGIAALWYVKMQGEHNPPYYLINRIYDKEPYVALEKDIKGTVTVNYFYSEAGALTAIDLYHKFHHERGGKPFSPKSTNVPVIESQVMKFE